MKTIKSILTLGLCGCLIANTAYLYAAENTSLNEAAINFGQLEKYAHLASASYEAPTNFLEASKLQGYTLTRHGNIASIKVSYFLTTLESGKKHIIAVRGTSNVENAIVDIALKLMQNQHAGIVLHSGFAQAAEGIYQEIRPLLNAEYDVSTTGHSLGGAVALILAMFLDIDKFNVTKVVTFGQPKVTNIPGAKKFSHLNVTRVVTPGDLVPLTPPFDPVDINNLDIYWHLGRELILLDDAAYSVLDGLDSMLRATKFIGVPINEESLKHHKMSNYIELLGKKSLNAKRVPYKNDFNIFGWFGGDKSK